MRPYLPKHNDAMIFFWTRFGKPSTSPIQWSMTSGIFGARKPPDSCFKNFPHHRGCGFRMTSTVNRGAHVLGGYRVVNILAGLLQRLGVECLEGAVGVHRQARLHPNSHWIQHSHFLLQDASLNKPRPALKTTRAPCMADSMHGGHH